MIYIDDHIWDFDLEAALAAISPQRRQQALRYRLERDQRLCVAAYRLLQQALRQEYGIEELPQFVYDASGKPLLEGHPDIHFSLSHCATVAVCVIGDRPVGVDVESFDYYSEEVARQVMNDSEMRQIVSSSQPDVAFIRLWTMKESFYKLRGCSPDCSVPDLLDHAAECSFTTMIHSDYALTICTKK